MKGISPLLKLLFGVLVIFGFALLVQHDFHPDEKTFRDSPWDPQLVLKKVVVVGWNHGSRLWRFGSDELVVDHQGRFLTYKGKGIGELFYDGKPFLSVLAPRIRFDMMTKSVQATGGVFLKARPSTQLIAKQLYWNQYSQRLYVPGKVFVKSPYGRLRGSRLTLIAYKGELKMLGVRMAFDPGILHEISNKSFEKGILP